MPRCICTISQNNVAKKCTHTAIYPRNEPKYCGLHKSGTTPRYVRSPSPTRRR